jgi:glycosyltransferase involved in cell wall biosynthesis
MNRERFLALQYECFCAQTYTNLEWLIHDGSEVASGALTELADTRVKYFHEPGNLTIGGKKSLLFPHSRGEIIMHLDDDDYYAPHYVATMVAALQNGYDLVKLSGFFLYSQVYDRLGYWDLADNEGMCQIWSADPVRVAMPDRSRTDLFENRYWGFGFSYAFRREVALAVGFPDMSFQDDIVFAREALKQFKCHAFHDEDGLVLHVLHNANTSNSFPQYSLPNFMVRNVFPGMPPGFLADSNGIY